MKTYAENYLTVRQARLDSLTLVSELQDLVGAADGGTASAADAAARSKLLEIEAVIAEANELFFDRYYREAIDTYKRAAAMIYQMLRPTYPGVVWDGAAFPLAPTLFEPLMAASLEIIDMLLPQTTWETVVTPRPVPPQPADPLLRYEAAGIHVAQDVVGEIRVTGELAAEYALAGKWERAIDLNRQVAKAAEEHGAEPGIAASAYLNLGAIHVQRGEPAAERFLARALAIYTRSGDLLGQAQVHHNLGMYYIKRGKEQQAGEHLSRAASLMSKIQNLPQDRDTGGGPVPSDIPLAPTRGISRLRRPIAGAARTTTGLERRLVSEIRAEERVVAQPGSTDLAELSGLGDARELTVTYRLPGKGAGWTTQPLQREVEFAETRFAKSLGLSVGDRILEFEWQAGATPPLSEVIRDLYEARISAVELAELNWIPKLITDSAAQLPHLYFYVIPVALGDCYHALGEYDTAEGYYLSAADYQYINVAIEVPALWKKLAENVLAWGDALYRDDEFVEALGIYRKVLEPPGSAAVVWGNSPLYSHAKLRLVGDRVETMLANYEAAGVGDMNPALAAVVLEVRARLLQLNAGLDFLGMAAGIVPIWSFEYLQQVARYFAQQAIQAEREFVSFWDKGETESLTRQQLAQNIVLAQAEQELAKQQREAAEAEQNVYQAGQALAQVRRQNAQQNRQAYENMGRERVWLDAGIAYMGAPMYDIEGSDERSDEWIYRHTVDRGNLVLEYELGSMDRQIVELQQAEAMAGAQLGAATARVEAAQQMEEVARLRTEAAVANQAAFENQFFTPDVWYQMGWFMQRISQSYLYMAVRVARLMQRAYNFENDLDRRFIKTDYSTNTVKGMLGGDALLLDIDSFTYDLIITVRRKQIPVKHTLSLAERYPFLFETELRRHGRMEFETRIEDFDTAYPGTYARRLQSLEVEVEGILPRSGVRGTLTNGGISRYRGPALGQIKFRIQPRDTMLLSDYRLKQDAVIFPADPKKLQLFEGAGVASTWVLEIPMATNDLDFRSLTDVRLTFYYLAQYDQALATAVTAQLNAFAGVNLRSRNFPLRWTFPDSFFHFQDTGQLAFSLEAIDFPFNELNPQIRHMAMLFVTDPGVDPSGWNVRLAVPAHPNSIVAQPNAAGEIVIAAGHPWQPLAAGAAAGDYLLEIRSDENPGLVVDGTLRLEPIRNIGLIIEYEYTPRV